MSVFDRRVTLRVRNPGTRNQDDEYVPGAWVDHPGWAAYRNEVVTEVISETGTRSVVQMDLLTRYNPVLHSTPPSRLAFVDDENRQFSVSGVTESPQRRRYSILTGIWTPDAD